MEPSFNFSIIQASPDDLRGEIVNVGVVADTPNGVRVHLPELRKLNSLTGHGWGEIATLYERRIIEMASDGGIGQLAGAKHPLSDVFTLSALGTITAKPEDLERQLQHVIKAYVARPKLSKTEKQDKINAELKKFFRSKELLASRGDPIEDHKVHAKFVVSEAKQIFADFALKSGHMKIAATLDFRTPVPMRSKAFEKGGTLWFAEKELGSDTEVFGVYAATPDAIETHKTELDIFKEYAGGNVFNWMVAKDAQRFAERFY